MKSHRTRSARSRGASRPGKLFTLDQANRALPLVRRVADDIAQQQRVVTALELAAGQEKGGPSKELRHRYHEAVERLRELADELTEIGCELKDAAQGLVDFQAEHAGRVVYLCWRLGEDRIEYWHELHTGFGGRQKVESDFGANPQ